MITAFLPLIAAVALGTAAHLAGMVMATMLMGVRIRSVSVGVGFTLATLTAAITEKDGVALDRWLEVALADEAGPRRVTTRARRAFAQAERAAKEGDLDLAISLLGESAESFRQSFLPFGETLARRRRSELLVRRNGTGDRDAAQAELAAMLPYWGKAKATWYLGQLRLWSGELGLDFPEGITAAALPSKGAGIRKMSVDAEGRLWYMGSHNGRLGVLE